MNLRMVQPRPEFYGEDIVSPITGEHTKFYSPKLRRMKIIASIPVTLSLIAMAIVTFVSIKVYSSWVSVNMEAGGSGGAYTAVGASVLNGVGGRFLTAVHSFPNIRGFLS